MLKTILIALTCSVAVLFASNNWQSHTDGRFSYDGTLQSADVLHATLCYSNAMEVLSVGTTPTTLTNFSFSSPVNGFTVDLEEGTISPDHNGSYDITLSHSVLGMGSAATYTLELYVDSNPTGFRFSQTVANGETECGGLSATLGLTSGEVITVKISQASGSSTITTVEGVFDARQL